MKLWLCGGILLALGAGCAADDTGGAEEPARATPGEAVSPAAEAATGAAGRTLRLELTAPEGGWSLQIEEIRSDDRGLIGYARLTPPDGLAAQVLTEVSAEVKAPLPDGPVRWVVVGKTWRWGQDDNVKHVKETDGVWSERTELPLRWRAKAETAEGPTAGEVR
jgi:hypothetical protein